MSQDVLKFFFQLWDGHEVMAFFIGGVGLLISVYGLYQNKDTNSPENKNKFSLKKAFLWFFSLIFGFVLAFASISGLVCVFYTEIPYLVGENLVNAREKLHQNKLKFDENTEQLIDNLDALDYTNYIVETQEPTYGIILRKNSTVSVKFTAKDIAEPSNIEQNKEVSEQNSNEDKSTSALPPTTPTTKPKPNTSTSNVPTSTPDSNSSSPFNDPSDDPVFNDNAGMGGGVNTSGNPNMDYTPNDSLGPFNDPSGDPVFNGNAGIGGGMNSNDGAGDFQPQNPLENSNSSEPGGISGSISIPEPW